MSVTHKTLMPSKVFAKAGLDCYEITNFFYFFILYAAIFEGAYNNNTTKTVHQPQLKLNPQTNNDEGSISFNCIIVCK